MGRGWLEKARIATLTLATEKGPKLLAETRIASELGLSRSALRVYCYAAAFVDGLSEPTLQEQLAKQSAGAVYAIGRLFGRDEVAARVFLSNNQNFSAQAAEAADRKHRQKQQAASGGGIPMSAQLRARLGNPLSTEFTYRFSPSLVSHFLRLGIELPDFWVWEWSPALDGYDRSFGAVEIGYVIPSEDADDNGLRFWPDTGRRYLRNGRLEIAALMVVPAQSLREQYTRQARTIWARSVVLSTLYPMVLIVLPDRTTRSDFAAGLLDLPYPRLASLPSMPLTRPIDGQEPPDPEFEVIRFPGLECGCVVVTSPETIVEDILDLPPRLRWRLHRERNPEKY